MSRVPQRDVIARSVRRVGSICVLGSSLIRQVSRISVSDRQGDDSLDEICLGPSIPFSRFGIGRHHLRGYSPFEVVIPASHVGVVTEIIAKRECSPFFTSAPFDQVYVMTVGPLNRPMEEWTKRVVRMRHVNVSKGLKVRTVR